MDKRTLVAGLIAGVVVACSEPATHAVGGAMMDAGEVIADAGAGMETGGIGSIIADAAAGVGGALQDAGNAMVDAASADGGPGDAAAQEPAEPTVLQTTCNIEAGRRVDYTDPVGFSTSTVFYAEVDIGDRPITDLAGAVFIFCDREIFGQDPFAPGACGANLTCTPVGTARPAQDCYVQSYMDVRGSAVSTTCGARSFNMQDGTMTFESGYRWNSVRLVIP